MRIFRLVLALALSTQMFGAEIGPTFLPSSATAVTTTTTRIRQIVLSNMTAGAVTVTIKDATTNCNAAACEILSQMSIAARATYSVEFPVGVPMTGGFLWQASAANSIMGTIVYGE